MPGVLNWFRAKLGNDFFKNSLACYINPAQSEMVHFNPENELMQ